MAGYLVSFSIYTMAMIGLIFLALFVFKTFSNKCFSKKSALLRVEDSMSLSPRKTLYVIKAEGERFLIAADVDKTVLISKLDGECSFETKEVREDKSSNLPNFDGVDSLKDFVSLSDFKKVKTGKEPMMKGLARKLSLV